jgi:poly-gamma-glutamate synthesis protein (capsule biosynthesis protein)
VPPEWAATAEQSGVSLVGDLDRRSADAFATEVLALKRRGDLAVVSIHWGSNWGYSVPERQRDFAMRLIDAGAADIVYGHSSHHPRPLEVYKGRLILYGCGDFVNDYEGIGGHEDYRPDLTLMYFPEIDRKSGRLTELVMTPMRIEAFQLHRATKDEADWLAETLSQCSRPYGVSVGVRNDGRLSLEW